MASEPKLSEVIKSIAVHMLAKPSRIPSTEALTRPCFLRTRGGTVRSGTRWRDMNVRWRPSRQSDLISGVNSSQEAQRI